MLELLVKSCDKNNDDKIDYVEFSNFLNWKDKMSTGLSTKGNENEDYEKKLIEEAKDSGISVNEKGDAEPILLRKQVDHAQIDYATSSSVVSGNVLNNFTKSENLFFFFKVRNHPFKTSTRSGRWGLEKNRLKVHTRADG